MELLGLGRAALEEPDGAEDVEEELQVLRLPVLGDVDCEVRGHQVLTERQLLQSVSGQVFVESGLSRERLPGQDQEERAAEGEGEAVVPPEASSGALGPLAHRCIAPIAMK